MANRRFTAFFVEPGSPIIGTTGAYVSAKNVVNCPKGRVRGIRKGRPNFGKCENFNAIAGRKEHAFRKFRTRGKTSEKLGQKVRTGRKALANFNRRTLV
jgi:hypothetical protein